MIIHAVSLQLQKVSFSSRVKEKGKTPCWEWCDFPESQPKAITRQTPYCESKDVSILDKAPKALFAMMMCHFLHVKIKGQYFKLATSLCQHLHPLPFHRKRRKTVFQRQQPAGAPCLQTVSIPPVGLKLK